jgi:hypothetical protein
MASDQTIDVSGHAAYQWTVRARDTDYDPLDAWDEATILAEPHGLEADEVRYHRPSGTVTFRVSPVSGWT